MFYDKYFIDFYSKQDSITKRKIDFVLDLIRNINSRNIRILCFFDKDNLIILLNCFLKKTNKTPKRELDKGVKLKAEYFIGKMKRN